MGPWRCEPNPSESVTALKLTATIPRGLCQPSCPWRDPSRSLEAWQNGLVPPACSTPPGANLYRRTFCRGGGSSRCFGEHGLGVGKQTGEEGTGSRWGPAPQTRDSRLSSPPGAGCGGPLASALAPHQASGPPLRGQGPWRNPSGERDGAGWGESRPLCFSSGLLPTSPRTVLTSELRRDRKGIREFEGLVSANREHRSLGVGPWPSPNTRS